MNKFPLSLFALLAAPALCLAADPLPGDGTSKPAGSVSLSPEDNKFVQTAADGGMAEVKAGELAKDQATNADVKAFGEHMVMDHTKANDDLKAVAAAKNVTLPPDVQGMNKMMVDKLAGLSGAAFDKAYVMDMLKDHKKTVADFEMESKMTRDPELKGFVDKTLPTLKDHLTMDEKLSKKLGYNAELPVKKKTK